MIKFLPGNKKGYTMVELLVAIGIFSVITTVAVGGFARALRTHREALALMSASSNVGNALEQIVRELRTGRSFVVAGGGSSISFDNAIGQAVTYQMAGSSIERSSLAPAQKITDSNVVVRYLRFNYINVADYPPRLVINLGISPNVADVSDVVLDIQTTVSGRNF